MTISEFLGKFKSTYLWGNLAAMALVVVALALGFRFGIDLYTHHSESIPIPNILHKRYADAEQIVNSLGLEIEVSDTGYVRSLPPGAILEQTPGPGERVKSGHIIYVTINATHSPTITLPDVIDNSSLREAMAKLTAMGFKLGKPQSVPGEKDWVYGITVNGRHVVAGDKIPIDATLIIQVGDGQLDQSDDINYIDPDIENDNTDDESGDIDNFQEIPTPPDQPENNNTEENTNTGE